MKGREMETPRHTEGDKEMERETETEGQTQSCTVRPSSKENTGKEAAAWGDGRRSLWVVLRRRVC